MLILHKFCVKCITHPVFKITQFVSYILHIICVYKIQTTQNIKFLTYILTMSDKFVPEELCTSSGIIVVN